MWWLSRGIREQGAGHHTGATRQGALRAKEKQGIASFGAQRRLFSSLLVLFFLAACGFQAIYAQHGLAHGQAIPVRIDPIPERLGQVFTIRLQDLINPTAAGGSPEYALAASIDRKLTPIIVREDGIVQRYSINLTLTYHLYRIADGKEALNGSLRYINSYDVSRSDFASFVSEDDATERGAQQLAEDMRLRLASFFATGREASGTARQGAQRAEEDGEKSSLSLGAQPPTLREALSP